uniref:Uncharacterized protein n=1 Tax=Lonomia obliqua TaxID=304329 RepID=Q5MGC8_LONON|nr:hypothetical protein 37 [Lonomia obliqua]
MNLVIASSYELTASAHTVCGVYDVFCVRRTHEDRRRSASLNTDRYKCMISTPRCSTRGPAAARQMAFLLRYVCEASAQSRCVFRIATSTMNDIYCYKYTIEKYFSMKTL